MVEQTDRDVETVAPEQPNRNRTTLWALIVGGCGVVVAIVALVIAISANSTTNDNAKISKEVRIAETREISGVRADLQRNVVAATAVLKRLQRDSGRAHRTDAKLRHDVNTTKTGINANRSQIALNHSQITAANANISKLQSTVGGLHADVKSLTTSVDSQKQAQQALTRRVKNLQRTVNALP
jgi:chromosome segregation ATPase